MRFTVGVLLLVTGACGIAACQQTLGPQSITVVPQPGATTPPMGWPNQEINDRFVRRMSERIQGRENEPAEQVFQNIQWLKGVPAGRFLRIMNGGYSRALGVSCTHCHVEQDFASDDKRPKRAAREMASMHRMINETLRSMNNLETASESRAINCATCHRGAINPMATGQ